MFYSLYIWLKSIWYICHMAKKLHRIKEVLKEQGKSAYWLAKETDITYKSIHNYLHNRVEPSLITIFRIAEALKVSPRELING